MMLPSKSRCGGGTANTLAVGVCFLMLVGVCAQTSDRDILLELYRETGGSNWLRQTGYSDASAAEAGDSGAEDVSSVCNWHGVTCDDSLEVIGLDLSFNQLQGSVPKSLWTMTRLANVNLRGNVLTDVSLPHLNGGAPLEILTFSQNLVMSLEGVGSAPKTIKELHFTENRLQGIIPKELYKLYSLEKVFLSYNQLGGTLNKNIQQLTNLRMFYLYENNVAGTIPKQISNLVNLEVITLSENRFTGSIPPDFSFMVNLRSLSVHNNIRGQGRITGTLPPFDQNSRIAELQLDGNALTGTLPSDLFKGSRTRDLVHISLSDNELSGSVPEEYAERFEHLDLDLTGNKFSVLPLQLCLKSSWNFGKVEKYGCNAIMCPVGTASPEGRQTNTTSECEACSGGKGDAPFLGTKNCASTAEQVAGDELEGKVLLQLFHSTTPHHWVEASGWDSTLDDDLDPLSNVPSRDDYCNVASPWHGLTCDPVTKTIEEINLANNGLHGPIPEALFSLPNLQKLTLARNFVWFDASFGMGDGALAQATKLKYLDVSGTNIRTMDGIGSAPPSLVEIHMDSNPIDGPISAELFGLTSLEIFHATDCGLSGEIPSNIAKMVKLQRLDLGSNEFEGTIPTRLGTLKDIHILDLAENRLQGKIPTELMNLGKLERLYLHQSEAKDPEFNGLTGTLPPFNRQFNIHTLTVDYNSLHGTIPGDFFGEMENPSTKLTLSFKGNQLSGGLPDNLKFYNNVLLEIADNQITGLPESFCSKGAWMEGKVAESGCNAIACPPETYGVYGREIGTQTCLECKGNKYYGATRCPNSTANASNGSEHAISEVRSEKEILEELYVATDGPDWLLGSSWGSGHGHVCSYEGVECEDPNGSEGVTKINLESFGLKGTIPSSVFNLPKLLELILRNNAVVVPFDNIQSAERLQTLQLSATQTRDFDGLENAPSSLSKLYLSQNALEGPIPTQIMALKELKVLYMTANKMNGTFPALELAKMQALEELYMYKNDFSGSLHPTLGSMSNLRILSMSENRFEGTIPTELGNLQQIEEVNLAAQRSLPKLGGPLYSFRSNQKLVSLNLARNSLFGFIPDEFLANVGASLKVHVDLSYNDLSGPIPETLAKFDTLAIYLEGNRITSLPTALCKSGWMDGDVGELGDDCGAILCPTDTYNQIGRHTKQADCAPCPETSHAKFLGSTECSATAAGIPLSPTFDGSVEGNENDVEIRDEHQTLKDLYEALSGFQWYQQLGWSSQDDNFCSWYGVTCKVVNGVSVVETLDLSRNNLKDAEGDGSFATIIFSLTNLVNLDLSGNDLPMLSFEFIGKAESLISIDFSSTNLRSIAGIESSPKLKYATLTANKLNGTIPEVIYDMPELRSFFVSYNQFSGSISPAFGAMQKMEKFFAYGNSLTGTIPGDLSTIRETLEDLDLGGNLLVGTLPAALDELTNLEVLGLSQTSDGGGFTGPLLSFSKLTKLATLDLSSNKLTGTIPVDFVSGTDVLGDKDDPVTINLDFNGLEGAVPSTFARFKYLNLDIVGNRLESIPPELCEKDEWMSGLVGVLKSDSNNGCDAIACAAGTSLPVGRQRNALDKCTPCEQSADEIHQYIGATHCIEIKKERKILGEFFAALGGKDKWTIKDGWMDSDKPICSWHGIECRGSLTDDQGVTAIVLVDNGLEGTVPATVYDLPILLSLNIRENRKARLEFEGIEKATELELLYLSETDMESLDGIGKSPSLKVLHVTDNTLHGTFPEEIYDLGKTLEEIYFGYNIFAGTLSKRIGELKELRYFYGYGNDLYGPIPTEIGLMTNLQDFVLAENLISGQLPAELSSLPSLQVLSLYRILKNGPRITGTLPHFDKVPLLTDLYLDRNLIHGTIPKSFLKSSLSADLITLSHNLLSGTVPSELSDHDGLLMHLEENQISHVPKSLCHKKDFMGGLVSEYGCDAILCPKGTYNAYGRQNSTDSKCKECQNVDEDADQFMGSTSCTAVQPEHEILKLFFELTNGEHWTVNDKWGGDTSVCEWHGISCTDRGKVSAIELQANNVTGRTPKDIFNLRELKFLWLGANPLKFRFDGIENARALYQLRIDSMGLRSIKGVGKAKSLSLLDARHNSLTGTFPEEILDLTQMVYLDLGSNKLTGTLPSDLSPMSVLQDLRLGTNELRGEIPPLAGMQKLQVVDLSSNKFIGNIPNTFLEDLPRASSVKIDLSSNSLRGTVPEALDRFPRLDIFLRDNGFTGVPSTLCENKDWNEGDVGRYGCDGIMCQPGTYNIDGRQRNADAPCQRCGRGQASSTHDFYGQTTCGVSGALSGRGSGGWHVLSTVAILGWWFVMAV